MGRTKRHRMKRRQGDRPYRLDACPWFIRLYQWMMSNGWCPTSKLSPTLFPATGRGLMALTLIKKNGLIVKIPAKLLVTKQRVCEEIPKLNEHILSTAEALSLYLLHCKINQVNTNYLLTLPEEFTVAALCSQEEVDLLPLNLQAEVICSKAFMELKLSRIDRLSKAIFGKCFTVDLLRWAWLCVNTRAVFYKDSFEGGSSDEDNMALAPFLDLLNHSSEAMTEAGYNPESHCYEIRTCKEIKKFDQVFIWFYGPHDNTRLFLDYGFVIPGNIHSTVKFTLDDLSKLIGSTSPHAKKRRFLHQLASNQKFFCSRDGFSWDARIAIAILCMKDEDVNQLNFPYDVDPENDVGSQVDSFSQQLVLGMIQQLEENLRTAETLKTTTASFSMAKVLMKEQLEILSCSLANKLS